MLVAHHRNVIEPVHIGHGLQEGLVFSQFLGATVKQSDMRVGALNDFSVKFQHQTQHAVRSRVLRTKIHGVVFYLSHNSAYFDIRFNMRSP